jgi:hypothetical protein
LAERTQFRRDRVVVPIARKHLLPDPLFFRCIFSGRSRGVNGTTRFVGLRQAVAAMSFRDEVQPAVPVLGGLLAYPFKAADPFHAATTLATPKGLAASSNRHLNR